MGIEPTTNRFCSHTLCLCDDDWPQVSTRFFLLTLLYVEDIVNLKKYKTKAAALSSVIQNAMLIQFSRK